MNRNVIIAASVGAGVLAIGGIAWVMCDPRIQTPFSVNGPHSEPAARTPAIVGRPMSSSEVIEAIIAVHERKRAQGHPGAKYHEGTPPANAREVPILPLQWTPLTPEHARIGRGTRLAPKKASNVRGLMTLCLNATRELLAASGRADEDPRAQMCLTMIETLWDLDLWGANVGNRKSLPYATAESLRAGRAWTTNPNASHLWCLRDGYGSFDLYPGFPDLVTGFREEKRFFESTRAANGALMYPGVLEAYRRGDLEGCVEARRRMHQGPNASMPLSGVYSPAPWATKEAECRGYWRIGERLCGADWRR